MTSPSMLDRYRAAKDVLSALPAEVDDYRELTEAEFLAVSAECTELERLVAARRALIAGEIAHRSRPALGNDGLARRSGHRTVENFLKQTAGMTGGQAVTAVRAGVLIDEFAHLGRVDELTGEVQAPSKPWLATVAEAVRSGAVSTVAAEVIGIGLGIPNSAVTAEQLRDAADSLVAAAVAGLDPDRLRVRARELRDELDIRGVALREEERRAARKLIHFERPGGGGRAIWDMDPETYAQFCDFYERATSPKTRGVRFVGAKDKDVARRIEADPRTLGQLASDSLLQMLLQGMDADTSKMLGTGAPVIRVTVAEQSLVDGIGLGLVDGQSDAVSIATVERLMCSGSSLRMGFDPAGNVLDLERERRTFSQRQREVLAAKFGGCMHPGCNRPPSSCEAHHILHYKRDRGKTVCANGILLCKFHHLKYHSEGWEIERDRAGRYWLIPPRSVDDAQTPIEMPLRSRALRVLAAAVS